MASFTLTVIRSSKSRVVRQSRHLIVTKTLFKVGSSFCMTSDLPAPSTPCNTRVWGAQSLAWVWLAGQNTWARRVNERLGGGEAV